MIDVEKLEMKKPEIKTAVSVVADDINSSTTETITKHCYWTEATTIQYYWEGPNLIRRHISPYCYLGKTISSTT